MKGIGPMFFRRSFAMGFSRDRAARKTPGNKLKHERLIMEQLNRVELRGLVGSVRHQTSGARRMAHFTVATSRAYRDRSGQAQISTDWHDVSAWEGKDIKDVDKIKKGDKVYVVGRLRYSSFMTEEGVERPSTEIVASKVSLLAGEESLPCEMF